jgi:hypothetical protein
MRVTGARFGVALSVEIMLASVISISDDLQTNRREDIGRKL